MQELAKAARNPKMLAEAMEMLKDPEIAAEVADEPMKSLPHAVVTRLVCLCRCRP